MIGKNNKPPNNFCRSFRASRSRIEIWQLAWPMILSNVSVPLLGATDTALLGHFSNATELGAVALGSSEVITPLCSCHYHIQSGVVWGVCSARCHEGAE